MPVRQQGIVDTSCPLLVFSCICQRVGGERKGSKDPNEVRCLFPSSQWGMNLDRNASCHLPAGPLPSNHSPFPCVRLCIKDVPLPSSPTFFPAAGEMERPSRPGVYPSRLCTAVARDWASSVPHLLLHSLLHRCPAALDSFLGPADTWHPEGRGRVLLADDGESE